MVGDGLLETSGVSRRKSAGAADHTTQTTRPVISSDAARSLDVEPQGIVGGAGAENPIRGATATDARKWHADVSAYLTNVT